ncbi:MAG: hypothetical protein ACKOX3_04630 [Bacteroidota bacterium]
MGPLLLLSTIIFFIASLVGCLILTLSAQKIDAERIKIPIAIHFCLSLIAVSFYFMQQQIEKIDLAFFCSGLMLSGIIIRKNFSWLLKIYFSFYLFLIPFFVYSPSLLSYFITGNYSKVKSPQTILLKENYFLAEQQSMLNLSNELTTYKIFQRNGLYKKTLLRDIDFGGRIDSLHVIAFNDDTLILRGFLHHRDTLLFKKPGMFKKGDIRKIQKQ